MEGPRELGYVHKLKIAINPAFDRALADAEVLSVRNAGKTKPKKHEERHPHCVSPSLLALFLKSALMQRCAFHLAA